MTRIIIKKLIWDDYNVEHVKKHKVTVREVEDLARNMVAHKKAKKGRYLMIGRVGTRILSAVINRKGSGIYYPISARDSDKDERRILYAREKI